MKKKIILSLLCLSMVSALASCGSSDSSESTASTAASTEAETEEQTEKASKKTTEAETEEDTEAETEAETEENTEAETEAETEDDLDSLYKKADDLRKACLTAATDLDASGVTWMGNKGALVSSDGCDGVTDEEAFKAKLKQYIDLSGFEYVVKFTDPGSVAGVWVAESWDSTEIGKYPDDRPLLTDKGKTLKDILDYNK